MSTEVRVINTTTAELELPNACPTCDGPLELRVSPEGARTFCGTCHIIARATVRRDPHRGLSYENRSVGLA